MAFLGINSNAHESEAAIREQARTYHLDFPMLKDPRNVVADLALVERTPEVLVLDGRAKLRYRGAIDDQYGTGTRKPEASRTTSKTPSTPCWPAGRSRWQPPRRPGACSTASSPRNRRPTRRESVRRPPS